MTPAGSQKFLFDRDFDKDEEDARRKKAAAAAEAAARAAQEAEDRAYEGDSEDVAEPEAPPPPSFSEEDLAQAREEGRLQGRDEAAQDMASAIEQRTAETLQAINAQMAQVLEAYEVDKEQHSRDAVAVAEVIVRKLFPALNMDKALSEIEYMIVEAMKRTSGNPQLIVRVHTDMQADVETRANELAALRGREGTVNIIGDADVAPGDARVEWDGGGMVRDTGMIWREIDDIIERNLGERLEMPQNDAPQDVESTVENTAPVEDNTESHAAAPDSAAQDPASAAAEEPDAEHGTAQDAAHDTTGEDTIAEEAPTDPDANEGAQDPDETDR